ncbi:MAG: hypothetical protein QX192_11825 [Methylococcales bacterium]
MKADFCRQSSELTKREEAREVQGLKTEIHSLERELLRKDRALAEAAALLVLQKKFRALLGGTAIMFLARKNTSIGHDVLAKNARTSTNMLDSHYLSTLENNDLADVLHQKDSHTKKSKKKKKESKIFTTEAVEADLTKLQMGDDKSVKLQVGKDGKVRVRR